LLLVEDGGDGLKGGKTLTYMLFYSACSSWTNRLITSRDKGSVQINVGSVDPKTGLYTGDYTPFALCGYIRSKGEGDLALTELASKIPTE